MKFIAIPVDNNFEKRHCYECPIRNFIGEKIFKEGYLSEGYYSCDYCERLIDTEELRKLP